MHNNNRKIRGNSALAFRKFVHGLLGHRGVFDQISFLVEVARFQSLADFFDVAADFHYDQSIAIGHALLQLVQ